MTERLTLTMANVDKLKPLQAGRRWVYDLKVAGLAVCITATGAKAFYLYKKIDGRPERHHLGTFPALSVDAARDKATKLLARIASGDNPAEAKRKERGELTLGQLFELYMEHHAIPHKRASSVAEDRRLWKRYLDPWSARKLSTIGRADVAKLHSRIGREHGHYAGNRALALMSVMYSVARKHGEWSAANPCEGVTKFKEVSRDRFLSADELNRFWAALDAAPDQQIADVFRLCLLTGARKSNVLGMRWSALDLAGAVWAIADTKQGEPQRVPLMPEAVAILQRLRADADGSQYVFPAREAESKVPHLQNIQPHWKGIIAAAGLPGLRVHDLRRTMGSWQAAGGVSLLTIGASLGHRNPSTTQVYARLQLDPVREAMAQATNAMMAAAASKKEGDQ